MSGQGRGSRDDESREPRSELSLLIERIQQRPAATSNVAPAPPAPPRPKDEQRKGAYLPLTEPPPVPPAGSRPGAEPAGYAEAGDADSADTQVIDARAVAAWAVNGKDSKTKAAEAEPATMRGAFPKAARPAADAVANASTSAGSSSGAGSEVGRETGPRASSRASSEGGTETRTETSTETVPETSTKASTETVPETSTKASTETGPKASTEATTETRIGDGAGRLLARGSVAELRKRLERLPPGHPSSPYHDDGKPKSPPPRLRHLELALPRERPPETPRPGAATLAQWSQAVAAPAADARPGQRTPLLPREQGRSIEPVTHADGSWSWGASSLTPAEARAADDAYTRLRAAEGRDRYGGYGKDGITPALRGVEAELEHGWLAPDAGRSALAEPDKFKSDLARLIEDDPISPPARLATRVRTALSYAIVFPLEQYLAGVTLAENALRAHGFELRERRNDWRSVASKRIATTWLDRDHDLLFEVQIHTPASLEARELARTSAALIGDPRIPFAEVAHLRADLAAAWAALPAPPGSSDIPTFRA